MDKCIEFTYWRGDYRHISYEIVTWSGRWAAYIILNSNQCNFQYTPLYTSSGRPIGFGYQADAALKALSSSDSVNGGVTFYDVITHPGDTTEIYKIGWDYSHYWDEGRRYNEHLIYHDVVSTIDKLWLLLPDIKVECYMVGGYHALTDGYVTDDGAFISNAGIEYCRKNSIALPKKART